LWGDRYAGDGDQGYSLSADRLNEIRKTKLSMLKIFRNIKRFYNFKGECSRHISGLLLV
jgi:hypothetical protein